MYETYRMLGEAHEADLLREARTRRLAAAAGGKRPARAVKETTPAPTRRRRLFGVAALIRG